MYLILKKGVLHKLVKNAIKKAGTIRKLAKRLKIPKSTIYYYDRELRNITESNLTKIEQYLQVKIKGEKILKKIPLNWKQIKGGKKRVSKAKKTGKFDDQLSLAREKSKETLRLWHKKMKSDNPDLYHKIQYERFKKIGKYKHESLKGEKVRNDLERRTANWLIKNKINYKFEPLIRIDNKFFFPDFVIEDKVIIECTMWRGYDKAAKLREKIEVLERKYKVFVLIPENLYKYYKSIQPNIIFSLEEIKEARFK